MLTPEEVKQYGLKVGEYIRLYTGGPVYKVETVNSSRAYCIPLKKQLVKVQTLNPESGVAEDREFDKSKDGGISIAVMSLVTRVTEEEALSSADTTKRQQPSVDKRKEGKAMAASPIPVAGKSARESEKSRRLAQARKRADRQVKAGLGRLARAHAKDKPPKTVRKCFCGCGEETTGFFAPGHDARFNGWLKQIEKGKSTAEKLLTKTQRDALGPWKKRGDGFVPSKNYKGEPYKGAH